MYRAERVLRKQVRMEGTEMEGAREGGGGGGEGRGEAVSGEGRVERGEGRGEACGWWVSG